MLEHQRSEFAIQEYYVQPSYKDETKVDETDSIPKCPVDITALQEITAETQTKLDDHSVLLDPGTVYKILLDWVTVLNKTFHELHLVKYTQSAQSHSEPASGDPGELEASKIVDNMKTTQGTETKEISIKHSFIGDTSETIGRVGEQKLVDTGKSALKSVDTPKPGEPGASILNDKDFCYTKDPLFLPANVFSNVSELAQVCFDLGCHGNILQYKDLQASQNKDEIKTLKSSKEFEENVIEFSDNLTDKSDIGTNKNFEDQGHSSESAQHSKGQGYKYEQDSLLDSEQDSLPGSSSKDICDTNLENANYTKLNESALMCSNHKESDSIVKQEKNADVSDEELAHMDFVGAVHKQNITENESGDAQTHVDLVGAFHEQNMTENDNVHPCPNNTIVVRGEGHCHSNSNQGDCHSNSNQGDCHGNSNEGDEITDEETAFFVRCYFPYLSAIKIRSKTKEHRKCWYLTWCALVSCLQGI